MTPPPPFTSEQLLEHGRSLRALARGILVDDDAAEDVVQDAWIMALERPPSQREGVGGWLHTVVRSLALKRVRGEGRRVHHERGAAQRDATASTVEGLESAALCKRLVDAVVALDEPYRTVISMRYFDDLPPREIALRLSVPKNTVRAQLQRGLAQLRGKLDGDSRGGRGEWAPALFAFVGQEGGRVAAPVASATSGGILGVLAMAGIGKLAAVAAVAVVLGFGYMQLASSEDEALVPREQEAQAAGPTAADLTSVAEAEDQGKREEASQAVGVDTHRMEVSQAPSWSMTKREPYELEVSVVDRFGRPAPGEQVYVAVEGQRFNAAGVTSRDGRLVLRFEAAVASLELQLFVRKWGNSTSGMRTLRMTSGSPRKLAIDLKPVSYEKLFGKKPEHYVGPLDHAPHVNRPAKAGVRFYTWGGVDIGLPIPEMIMTDEEFSDHNETSVLDARATGFSGVLHAANGEPASNALVEALPVGEGSHSWGYTDAQGAWAIDNLAAGEYRLRAGGDDYGIASVKFSLREGEARSWSPTLDRGREVRGRVLSPDEARRSYFVRGTHTNPAVLWSDSTLTDEEGRFAFPNAPAGVMQVEVFSLARTPWGIPVHVESGVTSDGIERDLVLASDALTSGSISIELSDAEGQPVRGAELRLYHGETRRGVFLAPVKNDAGIARYSVAGLPAGIYSLEVHFPSLGWFKRAGLVLDAGQQLELGQQSFAKPGLLIANADPQDMQNASAWQVVLLGDQVDSYTWLGWPLDPWEWAEQEAPGWTKVQLPAGDYALSVGKQAAGKAWFPFSIESGAETSLDLPLAQLCDVKLKFKGGYELGATTLLELSVTEVDSGVLVQRAKLEAGSPSFDLKLLPGRYHVALKDGGRLLEEHTVDVGRPR